MWHLQTQKSRAANTAATSTYKTADTLHETASTGQESLNIRFLKALEKTRGIWDNDKQFKKIVQKMQIGKNLKRKEFDKVHLYLREYCQYQ